MKIYISGPITGKPNLNRDAFARAAAAIRAAGREPVNPHDLTAHLGDDAPWEEYMKVCIAELVTCDDIFMLAGWRNSVGAQHEASIARLLNIRRLGIEVMAKSARMLLDPPLTDRWPEDERGWRYENILPV